MIFFFIGRHRLEGDVDTQEKLLGVRVGTLVQTHTVVEPVVAVSGSKPGYFVNTNQSSMDA